MKITVEHYQHLEMMIHTFEAANKERCEAHKALHTAKRYAWDIARIAGLTPFICNVLYKYANDTHIETALLRITKKI